MRARDDREREGDHTATVWRSRIEQGFEADLAEAGFAGDWESLTSRSTAEVVTDARSSWVRTRRIGPKNVYIKTYDYSSPADRRRGWGRTTWFARSRARREYEALRWFAKHRFPSVRPLLLAEKRGRVLGILHRACLVTEAWGSGSLESLWPGLDAPERMQALEAVATSVRAWHASGWRDRNLDPRNLLLASRRDGGFDVAKIDSPRFRLVRPGREPTDAGAAADWTRLTSGLEELGVDRVGLEVVRAKGRDSPT